MVTKIKEWYAQVNPEDVYTNQLGLINENVTFADIYRALENQEDIYKKLGCKSTTLRQYVFTELAEKIGCTYDDIYNIYLQKDEANLDKDDSSNVYLVGIPISGTLNIVIQPSSFEKDVDYILEASDGADYGALKNVSDSIDRSSEDSARECAEKMLVKSEINDNDLYVIENPVSGTLCISVKAPDSQEALYYTFDTLQEIKEQIQNDKSLIGDMDNPQINVGGIDLYEFDKANAKENKREKVGIER